MPCLVASDHVTSHHGMPIIINDCQHVQGCAATRNTESEDGSLYLTDLLDF